MDLKATVLGGGEIAGHRKILTNDSVSVRSKSINVLCWNAFLCAKTGESQENNTSIQKNDLTERGKGLRLGTVIPGIFNSALYSTF